MLLLCDCCECWLLLFRFWGVGVCVHMFDSLVWGGGFSSWAQLCWSFCSVGVVVLSVLHTNIFTLPDWIPSSFSLTQMFLAQFSLSCSPVVLCTWDLGLSLLVVVVFFLVVVESMDILGINPHSNFLFMFTSCAGFLVM